MLKALVVYGQTRFRECNAARELQDARSHGNLDCSGLEAAGHRHVELQGRRAAERAEPESRQMLCKMGAIPISTLRGYFNVRGKD